MSNPDRESEEIPESEWPLAVSLVHAARAAKEKGFDGDRIVAVMVENLMDGLFADDFDMACETLGDLITIAQWAIEDADDFKSQVPGMSCDISDVIGNYAKRLIDARNDEGE